MTFLVVVGALLFLSQAWPALLWHSFNSRIAALRQGEDPDDPDRALPRLVDAPAGYLMGIGFTFALMVYALLFTYGRGGYSLWDAEPAAAALAAIFGTGFGYARLIAPPIHVDFLRVLDLETGHAEVERHQKLHASQGQPNGVVVVVHNLGIRTWGSYRVSIEINGAFTGEHSPPNWPWASRTGSMRIFTTGEGLRIQELRSDEPLPGGGSYQARFIMRCDQVPPGTYPMHISMSSTSGISASRATLHVRVWVPDSRASQ